jgi:hypothetical protein
MRTPIHLLFLICAFACSSTDTKQQSDNKSFNHLNIIISKNLNSHNFNVPISITNITCDDSIRVELYNYLINDNKFKVVPALFTGKINSFELDSLNSFIIRSNLYNLKDSLKVSSNFTYSIFIKNGDSTYRYDCIDDNMISNEMNDLFVYSKKISDTTKLYRSNYFKYFKDKGLDLPPFPFEDFIEMSLK